MTINVEGLVSTGEFETRAMRETRTAEDYSNAWKGGATHAYETVLQFAQGVRAVAGPYDDLRSMDTLEIWLADKIREVNSQATDGTDGNG